MKRILSLLFLLVLFALPAVAFGQATNCSPNGAASIDLCNGFGTDAGTAPDLLNRIFIFIGTVIGTVAILMIVYSGFRMIMARGDAAALKSAKEGMSWAIIGFIVSSLSFVFVVGFQNFLGTRDITDEGFQNPLTSASGMDFISHILQGSLGFVGALAALMIVYNSFLYITSRGNDEQTKKAKSGLTWSVVGFITVLVAYVIITAVINLVGN
jgi:hypothetical protein